MATPASRTVPSSPNPSTQGSPRTRDWSNLRTGDPGAAFRGISRGMGSRGGGIRGGRGGGHPPINSVAKGGSHPDTVNGSLTPSPSVPSASRKPPLPAHTTRTPNSSSDKAVNSSTERGGRHKPGSRKQSRGAPVVVVAPTSPPKTSQTAPPTPSRSANRRRRPQSGKGPSTTAKPLPLPNPMKAPNPRAGSTLLPQTVLHKDVPPHLATSHEAEIRHDIDVLVERVRAVAMAENRPTTPGSHIDWAGDEDDSLPDLDDWGVITTHTNANRDKDQSEEISPILADTLKPLPEPNLEAHQEEEREMESYAVEPEQVQQSPLIEPPFMPSPTKEIAIVPSVAETAAEQCIMVPTAMEESSSPTLSDEKLPLHPSLSPKPMATMENLRARGRSISKPSDLPSKLPLEEALATKIEGLSESIHAPSTDDRLTLERVSSTSSSEQGLTASIHASVPSLPESHSAPSLLSTHHTSAGLYAHSRSQTEGRPGIHQPHTAPPGTTSHRHGRSGASSPLGKHVYTHSRNHSTPAGGAGSRLPQASRPVITGEAISRLARTIGGLGPTSRTQTISVTKDSAISS